MRSGWLITVAAWLFAVATAIAFSAIVAADSDLWGHLAFGSAILDSGSLPRTDTYSYTANGQPWINHEWLAELIAALCYRVAGDAGLLAAKAFVAIGIALLLLSTCLRRGSHPLIAAAVVALCLSAMAPGFTLRPQLASYLLFAVCWTMIERFVRTQRHRHLLWLPLLVVLWVNLHGGVLMGCALIGVVAAWQTLAATIGWERPSHWRGWWLTVALAALALLVNPYGWQLPAFFAQTLGRHGAIVEWAALPLAGWHYPRFNLMLLAVVVVFGARPRRADGWQLAVVVMTGAAALLHQRHAPFFALAAAPYLAQRGTDLAQAIARRFTAWRLGDRAQRALAAVFVVLAVIQIGFGVRPYAAAGLRITVDARRFPVAAVQLMRSGGIYGNIALPFDWGEYVIWHLAPQGRVSVDGRFETVYPQPFLDRYYNGAVAFAQWRQLFDDYPTDLVLVPDLPGIADVMAGDAGWVELHSDATARLYLRRGVRADLYLQWLAERPPIGASDTAESFFP